MNNNNSNLNNNKLEKKSGWIFHTHVTPYKTNKINDPLSMAFEKFLNDLLIDEEIIKEKLKIHQPYRLLINTNEDNDLIKIVGHNNFNSPIFLKSRFLSNRQFKQRLVDYYNPIGIFVKGPKEILKRDGDTTGQWTIELSKIHIKPGY